MKSTLIVTSLVVFQCIVTDAFQNLSSVRSRSTTEPKTEQTTKLSVSFGGIGRRDSETDLPRDVKDAVSRCRAATQEALKNRMSRMDIEFPVGTKFGVEKVPKAKKSDGAPTNKAQPLA